MNIAVISPQAHNTGNTTLAILIGLELASKGKSVCVTHANPSSASFYEYCNLSSFEDKTSTPSQVVKLLKEGAIQSSEVSDYCKKITEGIEVFSNNSKAFTEEDMNFMLEYIGNNFPHDYVIYDMDIGIYDISNNNISKKIINFSDVVIINVTQSVQQLQKFGETKEGILKYIGNKPIIVVVNKFCDIQSTIKETARWMGIKKPNNWMKLRYNPWITWGTNHGKIVYVFEKMKQKDVRVIDVASDLSKLGAVLMKIKAKTSKGKAGAIK